VTGVGSVLPVGQKYKVGEVYRGIQVAYVKVMGYRILVHSYPMTIFYTTRRRPQRHQSEII
jgi:hypothetical protein